MYNCITKTTTLLKLFKCHKTKLSDIVEHLIHSIQAFNVFTFRKQSNTLYHMHAFHGNMDG